MIAFAWLIGLLGPPLATSVLALADKRSDRVRSFAIAFAVISCVAAGLVAFIPELSALRVDWPWHQSALLGPSLLRLSVLSQPLVALPPILWLVTVAATPSTRLDRSGLARTAIATAIGSLAFLSQSPLLLAGCWAASSGLFLSGISVCEDRRAKRVLALYQLVGVLLLVVGILLATSAGDQRPLGLWLIMGAALVRKGIFPSHAWIPEAFDRTRIGPTVLFSAPQLGTYVAATLVLPHAPAAMLRIVAILSLLTAVYGAALALRQSDARRSLGYLFVSQSALVLTGLDCTSTDALTGALVLWISSALAFTGLARTVLALEARRGRLKLTTYHGGFKQMPLLATSFLLFGLACAGFPGTLGFIGQEMLIDGAVRSFPALGFLTIAAAAFTGLAVLRMYLSLFCGRSGTRSELRLRWREAFIFGGIALLLVVSGLFPGSVVRSRRQASEELLPSRTPAAQHHRHTSTSPTTSSPRTVSAVNSSASF